MAAERECWLCAAFEHWTINAVGVRRDDGVVICADADCARDRVEDWRICDVSEVTDLQAAIS